MVDNQHYHNSEIDFDLDSFPESKKAVLEALSKEIAQKIEIKKKELAKLWDFVRL